MSIWAEHFTTPVPTRMYTGRNAHGDPLFEPAIDIMCRVEYRRNNVVNATGETVVSEIKLYSAQEIPAGSLVKIKGIEWPVISSGEATGIDGAVDHYEMRC